MPLNKGQRLATGPARAQRSRRDPTQAQMATTSTSRSPPRAGSTRPRRAAIRPARYSPSASAGQTRAGVQPSKRTRPARGSVGENEEQPQSPLIRLRGRERGKEARPHGQGKKGGPSLVQHAPTEVRGRRHTKRTTITRHRGGQHKTPPPGFLQDISQALATLSQKISTGAYAPDSGDEGSGDEGGGNGPASRATGQHQSSRMTDSSTSTSPEKEPNSPRKRKRQTSRKRRCCARSSSESSLGESSSEDEGGREGDYWLEAAKVPGIPRWATRRRHIAGEHERIQWGQNTHQNTLDMGQGGPSFTDDEDPPGIHLPKKLRRAILNGYYVNIFSLLKPEGEEAITRDRNGGSKRQKRQAAERTFDNWLEGFAEFTGVVQAAYPERGWHLNNHYRNVLKARKLAGDAAALAYDEAFRKRASQSSAARWDLINYKHWLVEIGPNAKGRYEGQRTRGARQAGRRVCWEYNAGRCARTRCRYDHDCDVCFGPHPRVTCPRQRNAQQSFRTPRPPSKPNIQRDPQGGGATASYSPAIQK